MLIIQYVKPITVKGNLMINSYGSRTTLFILTCVCNLLMSVNVQAVQTIKLHEIREPEAATGIIQKQAVLGKKFMIAAANPYASKTGFDILEKGGSAIDAAIGVQMVLTLVEPQSSGIGGGAFILHWDKNNKVLTTFDGRETAPKASTPAMFFDEKGKAVPWIKAVVGGRSVGVPGVLKALKDAHNKYGKLPWDSLFDDAIELADNGFIVSERLSKLITMEFNPGVRKLPNSQGYFFPNNEPIQPGFLLKNKKLAKVFRSLANDGIAAFYQGWISKKIVDAVQHSKVAPGLLSLNDLKNYQAREVPAVCGAYHQYNVCGMGPPSSGGISVIQILAQLSHFDLSVYKPTDLTVVHLLTQSARLAFADRNKYIADSDFVSVPVKGLLSPTYIAQRAKLINSEKDMGKAFAGRPNGALTQAKDQAYEMPSTTHISIIDTEGNAISMTSSVEMAFGSAVMVEGFLLNNQLTDFSLSPSENGLPIANSIAPYKRPRSSMAPMMVFNADNSLKLIVGSPGGSRIINYVAQYILAVLSWGLDAQAAMNLPHVTNRNNVTTLENGTSFSLLKPQLEAKGHKVQIKDLNSGLHAIEITNTGFRGGADPRREGVVLAK